MRGKKTGDPVTGDFVTLKSWRDQIIRDLAAAGRIESAHEYTRFLNEVVGTDLVSARQQGTGQSQELPLLLKSSTILTAAAGTAPASSRSEIRAALLETPPAKKRFSIPAIDEKPEKKVRSPNLEDDETALQAARRIQEQLFVELLAAFSPQEWHAFAAAPFKEIESLRRKLRFQQFLNAPLFVVRTLFSRTSSLSQEIHLGASPELKRLSFRFFSWREKIREWLHRYLYYSRSGHLPDNLLGLRNTLKQMKAVIREEVVTQVKNGSIKMPLTAEAVYLEVMNQFFEETFRDEIEEERRRYDKYRRGRFYYFPFGHRPESPEVPQEKVENFFKAAEAVLFSPGLPAPAFRSETRPLNLIVRDLYDLVQWDIKENQIPRRQIPLRLALLYQAVKADLFFELLSYGIEKRRSGEDVGIEDDPAEPSQFSYYRNYFQDPSLHPKLLSSSASPMTARPQERYVPFAHTLKFVLLVQELAEWVIQEDREGRMNEWFEGMKFSPDNLKIPPPDLLLGEAWALLEEGEHRSALADFLAHLDTETGREQLVRNILHSFAEEPQPVSKKAGRSESRADENEIKGLLDPVKVRGLRAHLWRAFRNYLTVKNLEVPKDRKVAVGTQAAAGLRPDTVDALERIPFVNRLLLFEGEAQEGAAHVEAALLNRLRDLEIFPHWMNSRTYSNVEPYLPYGQELVGAALEEAPEGLDPRIVPLLTRSGGKGVNVQLEPVLVDMKIITAVIIGLEGEKILELNPLALLRQYDAWLPAFASAGLERSSGGRAFYFLADRLEEALALRALDRAA